MHSTITVYFCSDAQRLWKGETNNRANTNIFIASTTANQSTSQTVKQPSNRPRAIILWCSHSTHFDYSLRCSAEDNVGLHVQTIRPPTLANTPGLRATPTGCTNTTLCNNLEFPFDLTSTHRCCRSCSTTTTTAAEEASIIFCKHLLVSLVGHPFVDPSVGPF